MKTGEVLILTNGAVKVEKGKWKDHQLWKFSRAENK